MRICPADQIFVRSIKICSRITFAQDRRQQGMFADRVDHRGLITPATSPSTDAVTLGFGMPNRAINPNWTNNPWLCRCPPV